MLEGFRAGRAVVYDSGRSVIFISSRIEPGSDLFRIVVEHETSHIEAWQIHGFGIAEHGPEWFSHCINTKSPEACVTSMEIPR